MPDSSRPATGRGSGSDEGPLDLTPLPERLQGRTPPVPQDVLELVLAEHGHWRALHDRLIALIAALIDVAAADGRPVKEIIDAVVERTSVPLDDVVGSGVDAAGIAALLRAHGSTGAVTVDGATTTFVHECGTGLRYWKANPDTPTVADGEVPGVPGGRPRYCARCMVTIADHGAGDWTVQPPPDVGQRCTWAVTERP